MKKYLVFMLIVLMLVSIFPAEVLAQQESKTGPKEKPFHRLVFQGSPSPAGQAAAMVYALTRLVRIAEDDSVISTPMVTNAMKKALEVPQVNFAAVIGAPTPENPCYMEYEGDTVIVGLEPETGPYTVERPEGEPLLIGKYESDEAGNILLEKYTGPYPVVVEGITTCKAPEEPVEELPEEAEPEEAPPLEYPDEPPYTEEQCEEITGQTCPEGYKNVRADGLLATCECLDSYDKCENGEKDEGEIGVDCGGVCDTICDPEETGIPTTNVKPAPEWTEIPLTLDILCIDTDEYVAGDYDITVIELDEDLFKVAIEKNGKFMELPQSVTLKGGQAKEPFTLGVQCLAPATQASYPLKLKLEVIDYEDCAGNIKDPVSYITIQLISDCKQQCCPTGFYWDTYEKMCIMKGCDIRCPDDYFITKYCACISDDCTLECEEGEMLKQTAGQDCECVDIPADYPEWTTPPATCPTTSSTSSGSEAAPTPPAPTPSTPAPAPTPTTCTEDVYCSGTTYFIGAPVCGCSQCYMCTPPSWMNEGGVAPGTTPSSLICAEGKTFISSCYYSCKQSGKKESMESYSTGPCENNWQQILTPGTKYYGANY